MAIEKILDNHITTGTQTWMRVDPYVQRDYQWFRSRHHTTGNIAADGVAHVKLEGRMDTDDAPFLVAEALSDGEAIPVILPPWVRVNVVSVTSGDAVTVWVQNVRTS